jgi:lysophospholipase L1-like esterase
LQILDEIGVRSTSQTYLFHRALLGTAVVCLLAATLAVCTHAQVPISLSNPAVIPTDRLQFSWWAERHKAVVEAAHSHPDTQLLLIGDSIINNYDKQQPPDENFLPTWNQFYEPRKAMNLGFSGDTTANVLWRIDHGEVDGLHPKVALLLIGTNNTSPSYNQTAQQVEAGIDAIIADLERRLPQTQILLLGILPSDISDNKTTRDQAIDQYLAARYGENARVNYLDISSIFCKRGALNTSLFYDSRLPQHGKALHPDTNGQRMMAEAIEPTLAKLMGDMPRVPLASMTDINTALIPVARLELDSYDWYARHHAELEVQRRLKPRVVLIGDSITHFWDGPPKDSPANGPMAWQRAFSGMAVLNMGFGWDRTQNVLWRLRHGEFQGLSPQWVILAIGTNNLTGTVNARANTPAETVDGMDAVCREIGRRSPESRIVLMAILPRGQQANDPLRKPIQDTNRLLAQRFAGDPSITYLDIGASFLAPDGSLPTALMPDGTHPSDGGYQIWADALIKIGMKP